MQSLDGFGVESLEVLGFTVKVWGSISHPRLSGGQSVGNEGKHAKM